jgi:hypothetical protein
VTDQERDERLGVIHEVREVRAAFADIPASEVDDEADRAVAEIRADVARTA